MKRKVKGIGLVAKARSGKDTLADYAVEKYNMFSFAFGDALKKQFHKEYPNIPRKPKPVKGYQLYGQLQRYVVDTDIWVDILFDKIEYTRELAKNYNTNGDMPSLKPIITDVRQQNEVDRCKEEGYILIRINCPEEIRIERMKAKGDKVTKSDLEFETETALDNFEVDYEIDNSGSLQHLYAQFDKIMNQIEVEN